MSTDRLLLLTVLVLSLCNRPVRSNPDCPLEADPVTLLSCVAIDAVGLVQATKGNLRVFCTMAERFMECVKTKTRGCFGEEFVRGSLSELIELSQKCCVNKGEKISEECPFINRPQCFSLTDTAKSPNGTDIPIEDLKIGDRVLAMDPTDQIIPTAVISIIHYENETQALFYTLTTESGHRISVTPEHLLYVGNQSYLQAQSMNSEEHRLYIMNDEGHLEPSRIRSIDVELRRGYATPITEHGTLIVNRIGSSCYSSIYDHHLGHTAMAPLRWIHHAQQIFGFVNKEGHSHENGIHWYPRTLNNLLHMFTPLSTVFTTTMGTI